MLERLIRELVKIFQANPKNIFHEKQLHSIFYYICHGQFGSVLTQDNYGPVELFRQEYNSIYRYSRHDAPPFSKRYVDGTPTISGRIPHSAEFDFVILNKKFVASHELLTVINKDEVRRRHLRTEKQTQAIDIGIEFKMAHIRSSLNVNPGEINILIRGMLEDARKLALERIPEAFLVGLSHGPLPDEEEAQNIVTICQEEYGHYNDIDNLRVAIATPDFLLFP